MQVNNLLACWIFQVRDSGVEISVCTFVPNFSSTGSEFLSHRFNFVGLSALYNEVVL